MKKVITYGTYDLFHQGHYNLLKNAKALGDYLIVGVTSEHFDQSRGKINVVDDVLTRVENVKKTGFADLIIIEDHEGQKIEDIQRYGVDIFTLGSDWEGTYDYLKSYCEVVYLPRTPEVSSTQIRSTRYHMIRIGMVGTGRMVPRFLKESKFVSGIIPSSAYNPYPEEMEELKKEYPDLIYVSDSYEEFLEGVEAVYIASPNETHYQYAREALLHGKHVISEKPLAFTKGQTEELYELASDRGLVLIEAVKAAYSPGFQELINVAQSGKIGAIRDIQANFTRISNPKSRECTDAEYGGAFLEFGPSVMLPIIKLMGADFKDVQFHSLWDENGVDIYNRVDFTYENGMATARSGVGVKTEGQLLVSGTKGYILAPSPWWLMKHFEVRYEDESVVEIYDPPFQGDGLRYEISEFIRKINGNARNGYKLTRGESIAMARVTEAYMEYKAEHGEVGKK